MKKVLFIEDDPSLRENTAELLELAGYDVISASNGRVGVEKATTSNPDIVVCDIMMPELDGYGVLEQLSSNESTKHIPFIFLSAKTERKEVRMGMDLGADDYITKPFEEEELVSAIESRLAKFKVHQALMEQGQSTSPPSEGHMRTLNELKNFFYDNGDVIAIPKAGEIYLEGGPSNFIYLILKGTVKSHKMDEDGKELITSLHAADDFLGFTSFVDNVPYQESATAVEAVELAGISKQNLKDLLQENHEVSLELMELFTENIAEIKEQLLQMAYSSVRRKTAQTLLQFAEVLNQGPDKPIRIARSDLASVAGIATESLIRTLSSFKKEGLIEIEGRNIKILKLNDLEHML